MNENGIGLGLTIVKNLISQCEGQVEIMSDGVGKGTTVIMQMKMVAAFYDQESSSEDNSDSEMEVSEEDNSGLIDLNCSSIHGDANCTIHGDAIGNKSMYTSVSVPLNSDRS